MRITICFEGVVKVPNQMLEKNSLQFDPKGPYPITEKADWVEVLGYATDVRREEDGRITAEVPEGIVPDNHSVTIYADSVQGTRSEDGVFHITTGRLRSLFFDSPGFW